MSMNKYIFGVIVALFIALFIVININTKIRTDRDRLQNNQSSLLETVKHYKYADSLNAVSVSALQLKVSELKKYRAEDSKLIKELKIRPKDVEYITKTEIVTRDSLVYVIDSVGCFRYSDKWLKVDACVNDSSMIIQSRDSIAQVLHPVYKHRFLWWRWGLKGVQQDIINFNPRSKIEYSEVIKIK